MHHIWQHRFHAVFHGFHERLIVHLRLHTVLHWSHAAHVARRYLVHLPHNVMRLLSFWLPEHHYFLLPRPHHRSHWYLLWHHRAFSMATHHHLHHLHLHLHLHRHHRFVLEGTPAVLLTHHVSFVTRREFLFVVIAAFLHIWNKLLWPIRTFTCREKGLPSE